MTWDEEIRKLENEFAQAGRENRSMTGPRPANTTTTFKKIATLLLWLQSHLTNKREVLDKGGHDAKACGRC